MKKGWYIFLLLIPALLFSQENHSKKPKFYDRIQLIPEYQLGIYQDYYIYSSHNSSFELKENRLCSSIGGSIGYKNPYLFVTVGFFKASGLDYYHHRDTRLQANIGGNVLFFTKAAKNRSRLYVGASFVISQLFYSYAQMGSLPDKKEQFPLIGVGADVSFYNIHIRFSYQYFTQQFVDESPTQNNDRYLLFSIGYGLDLNTFRKKDNKRFDL